MNDLTASIVRKRLRLAAIVGLALAVSLAIVMMAGMARIPELTSDRFENATSQWKEQQLGNYEISVKVTGRQPGTYEVSVLNGIVQSATFDGRKLTRRRTFDTWAVRGMFETLRMDLETNQRDGYLLLRAEFDPEWGYPKKYERIEMRTGAHDALKWEVTSFLPHEGSAIQK